MNGSGLSQTLVVGVILIVCSFSTIEAGFCTEQYTCLSTCSKLVKYYESCGLFGWASCTMYRSELYSCYQSCSRQVCCSGYTGYNCNTPLCFGSTSCNNGGTCISPDICSCRTGFHGTTCTDIDECQTLTHGCKQTCDNTLGSYRCGCLFGYFLGSDKRSCIAMDSCSYNNGGCQHVCSENNNVSSCSCRTGFMLNIDRYSCSDVDECVLSTAGCEHTCINTIGSFQCYCDLGYSLLVDGKSCNEIDECQFNNGGCTSGCINEPGSYRCTCNDGYQLDADKHTCNDIDECGISINRCPQICTNTFGSFYCSCEDGYYMNHDGQTCLDIDDCVGVLCNNGGTCLDKLLSYSCLCKVGFTGQHCESDFDECEQLNGGCQDLCMNTNGSFGCSCLENRTLRTDGISCSGGENTEDTVFKRNFIPRELLPRPCFSLLLTECKDGGVNEIYLSSTSEWLRLTANQSVKYSYGIIYSKINNIFIPISLKGVTVTMNNNNFKIINGVQYKPGDASVVQVTYIENCSDYVKRPSDIFEFIYADSFIKTFLKAIAPTLPSWISFEKSSTEALAVQDMEANLVYGKDIGSVTWCAGAPVINDHIYSVFVYNSDFAISIYGKGIQLKKPLQDKKFCLIVDLCIGDGGTLFFMYPDDSQDWFLNIDVFKNVFEHNNILYKPRGIGLSLGSGISVANNMNMPLLWNGDVMFRPIFREANLWMSGTMVKTDSFFTIEGNAEVFYNVSNIQTLITTMFTTPMNSASILHLTSSPVLRFDLFGKSYEIRFTLASVELQTYASFGGVISQWCGTQSNPDGVFFTALLTVNPFQNVPILQDWEFSFSSTLNGFITSDMNRNATESVDITTDITALQSELELFLTYLDQMIHAIHIFSNDTQVIVLRMRDGVQSIKYFIIENTAKITSNNIAETQVLTNTLFSSLSKIKADVDAFQDATEFISSINNLTTQIASVINVMNEHIYSAMMKLNTRTTTSSARYTGFGLKCAPSIDVFGMKFPFEIDLEIVYSSGGIFQCSRFDKVSQLLQGERALRFLGRLSTEESYKLSTFLTIDHVGFGIGGAFSMSSENAVVQFNAFFRILGTRVTADIFLTKQGIYTYIEANIFDIFLAQLDVSAEIGKEWYELTYRIDGKFVAIDRKKRQIQTVSKDFHSSYLDALTKATKMIADEVESRLTGVQDSVTKAQNAVTKAQQWVNEKQVQVMSANSAFDQAVAKLDGAKVTLEQAKIPFEEALKTLSDAQKKVDNLCSIKTCKMVCVPGLKAKICHSGWFPYPCFETTSCMFQVPDLICEIANAGCKVIRLAAFGALELAKIFVKIPIAALDIAKEAVSLAQVVVDKSRVILLGAKGILELANIGLEFTKGVLEAAKIALEAVKAVVGAAARVVEFVIEFGLKNIVDVKNCRFSIEVSTIDLPVFSVSCEVNAFKLGWQTVKLTINFKNIVQTIWQAARATIDAIIKTIGKVFSGRKRREITFHAASKMHAFVRKVRNTDNTFEQLNQTIVLDQILYNNTLQNSDYESRVLLFKQKCLSITKIQSFMKDSFGQLWKVANDSKKHIDVANAKKDELLQTNINTVANTLTFEDMGISTYYAALDYNLSTSDLAKILDDIKYDVMNNTLLAEINNATALSLENITAESDSMQQINFVSIWLNAMANSSNQYFNESECVDFRDCIFHAISEFYNLYEDENLPNLEMIKNTLMELENVLLDILQNESSSIENTFISLDFVKEQVNKLINMNVFCSKPPQFTTILSNQTAVKGAIVTFRCHAKGDPEPHYWWYYNDELIVGKESKELIIGNISAEHAAVYRCMTGNIVANKTSVDAYLTVLPSTGNFKRQLFVVTFNFSLPDESYLGDVTSYKEVEKTVNDSLITFYKQHMTETFDIEISQLQPGSIVVEYIIIFDGTNIAAGESLVHATVSLSNGANLVYQGQTVFVHMDTYGTGPDPCTVYRSLLGNCDEGFECVTNAGRATCRAAMLSSNNEDFAIRIGVGVGCAIVLVCVVVGLGWFTRQKCLKNSRVNSEIFCEKQENVLPYEIANQKNQYWRNEQPGHVHPSNVDAEQ